MAIEQISECEYCGYKSREKASKCPLCGASLKVVEKMVADTYYESTNTNTTRTNPTYNSVLFTGEKNKIVAALLAFFAGSIGLHKFYMGNISSGIMYILFWWTAIPSILSLIEGISLLCMTDAEFNHKLKK